MSQLEPPRVFLWDIDGTLIDTTRLIVAGLNSVFNRVAGRSLPEAELRLLIGIPLVDQMRVLGEPETFGSSVDEMASEFIQFYEANRNMEQILTDVVDALIAGKRAGHPTALVTSKNLEELGNTLPRLGIVEYVDLVISADDVLRPKPDPEGVRKALTHFDAQPHEAVFIGDTIHDMQAGKAARVRTCAVLWGAGTREKLTNEQPDFIVEQPEELSTALGLAKD